MHCWYCTLILFLALQWRLRSRDGVIYIFSHLQRLMKENALYAEGFKSKRLLTLFSAGFPMELQEKLKWFKEAFDRDQALSDGASRFSRVFPFCTEMR
jgi:hypothetical protein